MSHAAIGICMWIKQNSCLILQELEAAGCVFQEVNGWERPGWFHSSPAPVLPYDWYGAYDHTPPHTDHPYYNLLKQDYTFDFPAHHHVVLTPES